MEKNLLDWRQKNVLLLLACGLSEAHAGERLYLGKDTIHNERKAIHHKLNVHVFVVALVVALLTEQVTLDELRWVFNTLSPLPKDLPE